MWWKTYLLVSLLNVSAVTFAILSDHAVQNINILMISLYLYFICLSEFNDNWEYRSCISKVRKKSHKSHIQTDHLKNLYIQVRITKVREMILCSLSYLYLGSAAAACVEQGHNCIIAANDEQKLRMIRRWITEGEKSRKQ